jgi:hypothetical protein
LLEIIYLKIKNLQLWRTRTTKGKWKVFTAKELKLEKEELISLM